jgi:hypothetical protein
MSANERWLYLRGSENVQNGHGCVNGVFVEELFIWVSRRTRSVKKMQFALSTGETLHFAAKEAVTLLEWIVRQLTGMMEKNVEQRVVLYCNSALDVSIKEFLGVVVTSNASD